MKQLEKVHSYDRYRGTGVFVERWTNAKAAMIGYLHGKRLNAREIADHLNDGTSDATIRAALRRRYDLPANPSSAAVIVDLNPVRKKTIEDRAKKLHCTPDEYARRIVVSVIDDDLYEAVIDGRF